MTHIICPKRTDANAAQFAENKQIVMEHCINKRQFVQHS